MGFEFKKGDIVEFGGIKGVVIADTNPNNVFPILVHFGNDITNECFTKDGKYSINHTKPLLVHITRPKKMIKKTISLWGNIYTSHHDSYDSKEMADKQQLPDRIACVQLTGTYYIEEQ